MVTKPQIMIEMDGDDFDRLMDQGYAWKGRWDAWGTQVARFSPVTPGIVSPNPELKFAYFFVEWGEVIMARAFVASEGFTYEISCDEGTGNYVIHTDYTSPHMAQREAEGSL